MQLPRRIANKMEKEKENSEKKKKSPNSLKQTSFHIVV